MINKLRLLEIEQQHLKIVSEFAVDMLSHNTVDEVLWHLARNVVAQLGFEDIVVYLFDHERGVLCQKAAFGNKNPSDYDIVEPIEIKPGQGVVGNVALSKQPLLIEDTRLYPGYIVDDECRLSELAVPMIADGQIIGVIDSEHRQQGYFTGQHQRTLTAIASIGAIKILNAQNHVRLQRSVEQLEYSRKVQDTLFEIGELTFNTNALSEFYQGLHRCLSRLTFTKNIYVALLSNDERSINFPYTVDEFDEEKFDRRYDVNPSKPGITEYVLQTNRPLLLTYQQMITMITRGEFTVRGKIPKAWLAVPFGEVEHSTEGEHHPLKGVVVVQSYYDDRAFDEKDKQLLVFVAKHVRNAIERMNARKALKVSHEHLQSSNKALEEARAQAEQASELKSSFVANISHEIRTPLTAIIGFTEQALRTQDQAQLQSDFLSRVLNSGQHLLHLINEILDLSKIEADKLELTQEPTDLFVLMADIESLCVVLTEEKTLDFNIQYHYPLPAHFLVDEVRLRQILLNLCNNAVKFTHEGAVTLSISYAQSSNELLFSVKDSGIGMSEAQLKRLFKPFVQADSSISRKYGGSGLGLVISEKLITMMQGRITVQSTQNKGSCFNVVLPLQATELTLVDKMPIRQRPVMVVEEPQPIYQDARILLAEDNSDNQFLIQTLLAHVGVTVSTVDTGQLAVEAAMFEDFDLILMDIQMPIMDGCEAVKLLRYGGIDCPIIALTANIMKEDVDTYLKLGFNDTLAKPIELESFYHKLDHYLTKAHITHKSAAEMAFEIANSSEIKQLKADFKATIPNLKTRFAQLAAQSDWQTLKDKAHQVKGSAGSLGFPELTGYAASIETYLKEERYDKAKVAIQAFVEQCEQTL